MTIQEAIKSGKKFKRLSYAIWHACDASCAQGFTKTEVLADDWETEPETISSIESLAKKVAEIAEDVKKIKNHQIGEPRSGGK